MTARERCDADEMGETGVCLRFDEDLRFFLAPRNRQPSVRVPRDGTSTIGHLVESLGVPLTEVGSLACAGQPVPVSRRPQTPSSPVVAYNSIENIAEFFASRGKKFSLRPRTPVPEPAGVQGFRPGQRVRHPKYGVGIVYRREGDGEAAKITVQFQQFGLKKLVEKYAQLEPT